MNSKLSNFTTEELQEELDRRENVEWPRHATVDIDYIWDDLDIDDLSQQLGWDIYNEDVRAEKFQELNLPGYISVTIAVHRNGDAEIVALNGKKISNEDFNTEPNEVEKLIGSVA